MYISVNIKKQLTLFMDSLCPEWNALLAAAYAETDTLFDAAAKKAVATETLLGFAAAAKKAAEKTATKKTPAKKTPVANTRGQRYRVGGKVHVGSIVSCRWKDKMGNLIKHPFTGIVTVVEPAWIRVAHPKQCRYPPEIVDYTLGDFEKRGGRILNTPSREKP